MDTPPATQSTSRSSTGLLSEQSTLVPNQISSEALRKALDEFKQRLTGEELAKFQNTTFESLRDELHTLQQQQAAKKDMMNLTRIQAFLEGMQQLTKTIEVFLNASNFVAFVWGPVKFLLLVCILSHPRLPLTLTMSNRQVACLSTRLILCSMPTSKLENNYQFWWNTNRYLTTMNI